MRRNKCNKNEVLCSGYCVKALNECPITKLQILPSSTPTNSNSEEIFRSQDGKSYRISRVEGVPIVAIMASFETKCAND